MTQWTRDDLERYSTPDELHISSRRDDGSFSRPVTIWMVAVGDDLYARSVHGSDVPWYQAVKNRAVGRITVNGSTRDVRFEAPIQSGLDEIDQAYQKRYAHYPSIVPTCLTAMARECTFRISPVD